MLASATPTSCASDIPGDVAEGTIIDGRYRIERRLGAGGMGTVFLAEHVTVGRKVAVKILEMRWGANAQLRTRFLREARAASAVAHPNIIDVIDAGELPDGRPFLVMEYLDGETLAERIGRVGRLSVRQALAIAYDVASALAVTHDVGVVHRDLKPENVMFVHRAGDEILKVLDFGIAYDGGAIEGRLTRPGTVMGTPEYMAPEQAAGAAASPSFDVYAIGVLLYEMLAGQTPFGCETPVQVLTDKALNAAPSIASRCADLPPDLVTLIDDCLARDPKQRPVSARLLAQRLATFGFEAGSVGPQLSTDVLGVRTELPTDPQPPRRSRSILGFVLLAAGAALITALIVGRYVTEPTEERAAASVPPAAAEGPAREPAPVPPSEPVPVAPPEPVPTVEATAIAPAVIPPPPPENTLAQPTPRGRGRRRAAAELPSLEAPPAPEPAQDCTQARARAREARQVQDWAGVLKYLGRGCGSDTQGRTLRVKALAELGRFAECVKVGGNSSDPEIQRIVKLCQQRQ